jgi:hypothetical protein
MKLLDSRPLTKEGLIKQFKRWDTEGRTTPVTAELLVGMFYLRYRTKYSQLPITPVNDDVMNLQQFVRLYTADDPMLAVYVIEVLFGLKKFNGITTAVLLNKNILIGWALVEKGASLRQKPKSGEQAEFVSDRKSGTLYV